ncbi:MAG: DUF1217 domain-containing protein [Paracoccus sp. (in: a-proteobacteria)]|nr:DUF1217 domain-containing protein [Paracoccus sp. (in: a-proteobacteria)]
MSFIPLTGGGGYLGWKLLTRTMGAQKAILENSAEVGRKKTKLREGLGKVTTAEQLVSDRSVLAPALTAYGLEGDIRNRFLIQKILSEGVSDPRGLASRMADKRYARMATDFRFDSPAPATSDPAFGKKLFRAYLDREFERRVGETDQNLRLALNAQRELKNLAGRESNENTKWYEVLGTAPLRKVFEGAFGLGTSFGKLPIDRQLSEMRSRADKMFGSSKMEVFSQPEATEKLIRTFLVRSSMTQAATQNPYSTALALLSR